MRVIDFRHPPALPSLESRLQPVNGGAYRLKPGLQPRRLTGCVYQDSSDPNRLLNDSASVG
jgi:hypothetical protein